MLELSNSEWKELTSVHWFRQAVRVELLKCKQAPNYILVQVNKPIELLAFITKESILDKTTTRLQASFLKLCLEEIKVSL